MIGWIALYILFAYLAGAVPFGYLAGKAAGIDLRLHGSCNTGATNVWRVLGWSRGLPVFILDFLKGFLPVLCAWYYLPTWTGGYYTPGSWGFTGTIVCVCFATVLGHTYTCFLNFKGGKGVATTAGVLFALNPWVALSALVTWLVFMGATGMVSLGSVMAALAMIIAGWCILPTCTGGAVAPELLYQLFFTLVGILVIFKHRSNIVRLLQGKEHSFYSKKNKRNDSGE